MSSRLMISIVWMSMAAISISCSSEGDCKYGMGVLYNEDGTCIRMPTLTLLDAMDTASDANTLLNKVLRTVETNCEYAGYVAARALIRFYSEPANVPSPEAIRILCTRIFEIAEPLPRYVRVSHLTDHGIAWRIEPQFVAVCDGERHVLYKGLLPGWEMRDGVVILDGVIVKQTDFRDIPYAVVNIEESLGPKNLHGDHVIRSTVVLVSPSGIEMRIRGEWRFAIVPDPD